MSTFTKPVKVNYLQNATLLREIHLSKITFSYYVDDRYRDYDLILDSEDDISTEKAEAVLERKAELATKQLRQEAKANGIKRHSQAFADLRIEPSSYTVSDVTFRVMTYDHIPLDPAKNRKVKSPADQHVTLNFPPYKHYAYDDAGQLQEVGRSHWVGGLDNGWFSQEHGRITNNLAKTFPMLATRYGQRGNFRGYSYLDEMKSEAIIQLLRGALKFNEARSDNPFGYYTMITHNAFLRVLKEEQKQQNLRDDLLESAGLTPSSKRQLRNEGGL